MKNEKNRAGNKDQRNFKAAFRYVQFLCETDEGLAEVMTEDDAKRIAASAALLTGTNSVSMQMVESVISLMCEEGDLFRFRYRGRLLLQNVKEGGVNTCGTATVLYNGEPKGECYFELSNNEARILPLNEKTSGFLDMFSCEIEEMLRELLLQKCA